MTTQDESRAIFIFTANPGTNGRFFSRSVRRTRTTYYGASGPIAARAKPDAEVDEKHPRRRRRFRSTPRVHVIDVTTYPSHYLHNIIVPKHRLRRSLSVEIRSRLFGQGEDAANYVIDSIGNFFFKFNLLFTYRTIKKWRFVIISYLELIRVSRTTY